MSSNIKVEKLCLLCGNKFIARKTTTKYCSHKCSARAYKARNRDQKIQNAVEESAAVHTIIYGKEFLSVVGAAKLLNVSRWTIYRYLSSNTIPYKRLGRKTFIRRSDIESLFDTPPAIEIQEPATSEITDWYSVKELKEKFGMSSSAIYLFAYERNIPKKKEGKYTLYSKTHFDEAKRYSEPESDYYTIEEAMAKFNLSRDSLYRHISINKITKIKDGRYIKISKVELDTLLSNS